MDSQGPAAICTVLMRFHIMLLTPLLAHFSSGRARTVLVSRECSQNGTDSMLNAPNHPATTTTSAPSSQQRRQPWRICSTSSTATVTLVLCKVRRL